MQLFLLLWEGVQFFLILPNFLCSAIATVSLLLTGRFFSSAVHFTMREGCALPLVITPVPSCCALSLYFGSHYQPQNNRTRLNGSCVVASFCHPLFLSFCLLLMPAPGKEGRQVLSCKQEGGVEVLWPEVITPVTSSAPPQHPPTLLPHPPQQNSKFTIHNLASSCNKPI